MFEPDVSKASDILQSNESVMEDATTVLRLITSDYDGPAETIVSC